MSSMIKRVATIRFARRFAAITFGILLPIVLLFTAYGNLQQVSKNLHPIESPLELEKNFAPLRASFSSANDYILFSLMFVEQSNQRTMLNKQAMKLTVIHIGFAIMFVGLMFIVLGINDGGVESVNEVGGHTLNFKTASTGLVVFLGGALMASGGALLNNLYTTAGIPGYVQVLNQTAAGPTEKTRDLVELYKSCKAYEQEKFQRCLVRVVEGLYSEELK